MAANFWTSCHFKSLMDQKDVDVVHPVDKERGITLEDFKLIKMRMTDHVTQLAYYTDFLRQRVVATAVTYMRRFYTRRPLSDFDPRLVAPTCLYLASKAEECDVPADTLVLHNRKIFSFKENRHSKCRYEVEDIWEMEMKILEALNDCLLVFHPYHSLSRLLQDAGMNDVDMIQSTWGLVNDTYLMDLALVHPPYLIALACIFLSCVQKERDATAWFGELNVDMDVVKNISLEILDLYENRRSMTETRLDVAFGKLRKLKKYRITKSHVTISP